MFPIFHLAGEKIAVLGLGRSGLSVALAAQAGGAEVIVWDDNEKSREKAMNAGLVVQNLRHHEPWDRVHKLIVSPGIPHLYPEIHPIIETAYRKGVSVDNDISLFFSELNEGDFAEMEFPPRIIAVTGSNGKSTTSALLHHTLKALGKRVQLGGNIGRGVFDLDPPKEGEFIVLELSSYQTDLAHVLTPDVAIFTNLTPDHLDRHNGMGGYFAAKSRLFTQSFPRAVIGVSEKEGLYLAHMLHSQGARVTPIVESGRLEGWENFIQIKKGFLSEWRKERQAGSLDLRELKSLPGAHNHQNAACVYGALRHLLFAPKDIGHAMASFGGLRHRSQVIAKVDGVTFVNDSKATNADAAYHALNAFQNILWIAGGREKEGGISSLEPIFDRVKKAYLIGESAQNFAKTLAERDVVIFETLADAMAMIKDDAEAGDVVLLSPAAASFDQYPDFEKRGEDFERLVKENFLV